MSSVYGHHTNDPPSTSDSLVNNRKGKVRNPCFLYKDMHFTYLCPLMDEDSKLLEDITIPRKQLPTGYRKLSLETPLVDQVVDTTLPSNSEFQVVNLDSSVVDPTLPQRVKLK